MKIISLKIKNNFLDWEFEEIKFTSNLALLVGASGVGKTQILRAINDLKYIADGESINGFEWQITFSTILGNEFIWEGAFSVLEDNNSYFFTANNEDKITPVILSEKLINKKTSEILIFRNEGEIRFNGNLMPKLSSTQSMIYTLKEEKSIKEVNQAFNKIIFKDNSGREALLPIMSAPIIQLKEKYKTFQELKNSNEDVKIKLFLCSQLDFDVFYDIKNRFIDIFPQIEDIKIEQIENMPRRIDRTYPVISIKEIGVPKWVKENRISSGMLRTIIHICEIFLSNDGSVILIDEFENSLGVNCIDILTDDLIHENKNIQFIATSHHPYIINNIPYEYWKIVSRQGGKIQVRDAANYNLGKSKQNAFIQLTKILEKQQ